MHIRNKMIMVVSGKKQSGKNTICNMLAASFLNTTRYCRGDYTMEVSNAGELYLRNASGLTEPVDISPGIVSPPFRSSQGVRIMSFADPLKDFCINVLGLTHAQCWGSDADKNTITHLQWEGLSVGVRFKYRRRWWLPVLREGAMTAREVMQVFGTDVIRQWHYNAWRDAAYKMAQECEEPLAIICDGRFPNEMAYEQVVDPSVEVKTIRTLRNVTNDTHPSETSLDGAPEDSFDLVFPADSSMSTYAKNLSQVTVPWLKQGLPDLLASYANPQSPEAPESTIQSKPAA